MDEATLALADYKSSYRHLAWSFRKSRDNWKAKHHLLKRDLKRLQNHVRSLSASRDLHKQAALASQQRLAHLQAQLDLLQSSHTAPSGEKGGAALASLSSGNCLPQATASPPA